MSVCVLFLLSAFCAAYSLHIAKFAFDWQLWFVCVPLCKARGKERIGNREQQQKLAVKGKETSNNTCWRPLFLTPSQQLLLLPNITAVARWRWQNQFTMVSAGVATIWKTSSDARAMLLRCRLSLSHCAAAAAFTYAAAAAAVLLGIWLWNATKAAAALRARALLSFSANVNVDVAYTWVRSQKRHLWCNGMSFAFACKWLCVYEYPRSF